MRSLFLVLSLLITSIATQAGVVTMNFTASPFSSASAPDASVSGSFTWEATSLTAPIQSLLSVDLAIAGHTYTLAEVGFSNFVLGALPSGITTVDAAANADDFLLSFNPSDTDIGFFAYGVQGITNEIWFAQDGSTRFSFANEVPEPGTLALVTLALVGAIAARSKAQRRGGS